MSLLPRPLPNAGTDTLASRPLSPGNQGNRTEEARCRGPEPEGIPVQRERAGVIGAPPLWTGTAGQRTLSGTELMAEPGEALLQGPGAHTAQQGAAGRGQGP